MAKTRQQKQSMVDELKGALSDMKGAVFAAFDKLPVAEDWAFRKTLRAADISYRVIKKTLFNKAAKELNLPEFNLDMARGNIGMLVSGNDEVVPAKELAKFAKGKDTVNILGGYMKVSGGYDVLDQSRVKALATLPGKQELLGQFVRTIKNPVTRLHGTLVNPLRGFVNVLQGIARAKS